MTDSSKGAVVITGVSSGIGEVISRHMMDAGYRVFGSVRKPEDANRLLDSHGALFQPLVFDVRDRKAVASAAQLTASKLGRQPLTALINNAGIALFGPMECLDDQEFEESIAINLFGTRNVTNAFLPLLRGTNYRDKNSSVAGYAGKIINISSLSGILNTPMNGAYCVSKHAVESLGEIYRRELLYSGIDVCSIRSGPIQSEIWAKNDGTEQVYENQGYTLMSNNAREIMQNAANNALPASVISNLVLDIIENRKRKVAYEIGAGSFVAKLFSSMLPARWVDRLIGKRLTKSSEKV